MSAPRKGERRRGPNGEIGVWDGSAWRREPVGKLLGGAGATLEAGVPQGLLSRAWDELKSAVTESDEQAEAREAGIGTQPSTGKMLETIATGASIPMMASYVNPGALARGLAAGIGGAAVGGEAGHLVGKGLEKAGAPAGTAKTLGTVGGVAGGILGPTKGLSAVGEVMSQFPHSKFAVMARMLGIGGAESAATATAAEPLMDAAAQLAKQKTFGNAPEALAWLKSLNPEQQAAAIKQLGGTAAPVAEKVVPMAEKQASKVFQTLAQRAGRRAGASGAASVGSEAVSAGKIAPRAVKAAGEAAQEIPEAFRQSTRVVQSKSPLPFRHGKGATASKQELEAAGDRLFDQIKEWKKGFSDAQVQAILRENYGIGATDAKVMIREVMKKAAETP